MTHFLKIFLHVIASNPPAAGSVATPSLKNSRKGLLRRFTAGNDTKHTMSKRRWLLVVLFAVLAISLTLPHVAYGAFGGGGMGLRTIPNPIKAVAESFVEFTFGGLAKIVVEVLALLMGALQWLVEIAVRFLTAIISVSDFQNVAIVNLGWHITLDFVNLLFILILLVIGFATIFRMETYGIKALLPRLIIVALFINFSKVIAGVIIDVGNLLTQFFLTPMGAPKNLGNALMNLLNLQKAFRIHWDLVSGISGTTEYFLRATPAIVFGQFLGVVAMAVVVAGLFLYAGVFIVRIVVLWLLVIVAPLAWISSILPGTRRHFQMWWSNFIKWVMIAPIMVFFLFLLAAMGKEAGSYGLTGFVDKQGSTFGVTNSPTTFADDPRFLLQYAIVMGFILAGPIAANTLGAAGASGVIGIARAGQNWALGKFSGYRAGKDLYRKTREALKETKPRPLMDRWGEKLGLTVARGRSYMHPTAAGRAVAQQKVRTYQQRQRVKLIGDRTEVLRNLSAEELQELIRISSSEEERLAAIQALLANSDHWDDRKDEIFQNLLNQRPGATTDERIEMQRDAANVMRREREAMKQQIEGYVNFGEGYREHPTWARQDAARGRRGTWEDAQSVEEAERRRVVSEERRAWERLPRSEQDRWKWLRNDLKHLEEQEWALLQSAQQQAMQNFRRLTPEDQAVEWQNFVNARQQESQQHTQRWQNNWNQYQQQQQQGQPAQYQQVVQQAQQQYGQQVAGWQNLAPQQQQQRFDQVAQPLMQMQQQRTQALAQNQQNEAQQLQQRQQQQLQQLQQEPGWQRLSAQEQQHQLTRFQQEHAQQLQDLQDVHQRQVNRLQQEQQGDLTPLQQRFQQQQQSWQQGAVQEFNKLLHQAGQSVQDFTTAIQQQQQRTTDLADTLNPQSPNHNPPTFHEAKTAELPKLQQEDKEMQNLERTIQSRTQAFQQIMNNLTQAQQTQAQNKIASLQQLLTDVRAARAQHQTNLTEVTRIAQP